MDAPETHLICCGLPDPGLRATYLMLRNSLEGGVKCPLVEMAAEAAIAPGKPVLTLSPQDLFRIDEILESCAEKGKRPKFVIQVRDPRDALVQRGPDTTMQPALGVRHGVEPAAGGAASLTAPGLGPWIEAVSSALARPDVETLLLRREDVAHDPAAARARVAAFSGFAFREDIPAEAGANAQRRGPAGWRTVRGAATVARAFRLYPALSEGFAAWGYAPDPDWLEALCARVPAAMDDSPGVIVAYYTEDSIYEAEARRLEASVCALGLPIDLHPTADQGSWLANVRFKPTLLADARRRLRGPILYVDADAVLHSDPWPELRGYDQDAAFCVMRDGLARSGTVLLNDTPGALRFLDDWRARLDADPAAWDQTPLSGMLADARRAHPWRPDYTVGLLSVSMCHVFDRDPARMAYPPHVPVVEHLQASRELTERTEVPGGTGKLALRRERLSRLESAR